MPITSTKILCRDAKGVERYWFYEVDGEKWRGHSGHSAFGAADVPSGWKTCKAKNVGKKNSRTPEEQAAEEAEAEFRKKLDREYRRTQEELDNVPLSPMLAQKYKDLKKGLRFTPRVYTQPKLDGIRMLASTAGGLSRDYQPFGKSVEHIQAALAPVFEMFPDLVFDGELYNHTFKNDFNSISSLVRTETLDETQEIMCARYLQYHVYDLAVSQPRSVKAHASFAERSKQIEEIAERFDFSLSPIVVVPTYSCETLEDVDRHYGDFLAAGYEGQMIRTNEAYENTRSWSLLKRKEFIDIEVPIIRLIMGEGNWDSIPKAIEFMMPGDVRGEDGNRPKASIKGNMDFCRSLVDRKPKFATVRYFALTPAGVPRMPVAVDFHDEERKD